MEKEDTKIFNKENRIYKYYINDVEHSAEATAFIKSLVKLELIELDKSEEQDLIQLYDILGFDKFFEVVTFFSSKTIRIPKIDKLKKMLIVAIAYYQTVILNLSPKDAGKILSEKLGIFNLKQKNIKALVNKLQQSIDRLADTVYKRQCRESSIRGKGKLNKFEDFEEDE